MYKIQDVRAPLLLLIDPL